MSLDLYTGLKMLADAQAKKQALREKHRKVFLEMDAAEEEIENAQAWLKTAIHEVKTPPQGMEPFKGTQYCLGRVPGLMVVASYTESKGYYDPKKLPKEVLSLPGVISAVDTGYTKSGLLVLKKSTETGWVPPVPKTPAVSFKALGAEDDEA